PSNPYGFKVTNLLLHLLNGVLAFGLSRTISSIMAPVGEAAAQKVNLIALLCAALWLLSPIQISAVFLTVQRMTELAATFALAGLWGFFVLLRRAHTLMCAFVAVFVLGIGTLLSFLCKENGALTPLL